MQKEFIETERLILRKFKKEDALQMFINWTHDEEVTKYVTWSAHQNLDETRGILSYWLKEYDLPTTNRYCITVKGNDEPLGSIDVVHIDNGIPELGYCLAKKAWNKGYATEAAKALIDDLLGDEYQKICICAFKENIASNRVIQKCGFKFVKEIKMNTKNQDVIVNYYILEK